MADKQAGGLSLRIGLTLSQLQSDFLAAEQTVKQGIAAINRQQNIIKLRTEADLAGLDAVADKTKIIEVQERSLTQLLDLQRDKLKLATAAYQDVAQSKGANSAAAKQLEASMERERIAVARLEAQLKSLSAQKISVDTSHLQDTISKLNARIQHIKIKAEIDTSKLQGANAAFDAQKIHIAAVTKEIELQREKLTQLQAQMYKAAQANGAGSVQTLNIKSNVLQQIQQINQLEAKLKELRATNVNLQIRADSLKQVEASIHENIARINAKIEHICVKTDIDVSKLGAAATEFDKAKAHVQGLNRELDLQNKKLLELKNALRNSISANGLNNVKTINLQTEIQKQIQAINQLKAKIQELNNIAPPKSSNNLLSNYLNIKGDVTGALNNIATAFSNLQGATSSADNAIVASLSVIGSIPHPVGRAVAAFAAMPIVLKGVENSLVDMARAATAAGDATYVMSRGFQMSVADTGKFTTMCKTAGVEVNDLASTLKRVQQTIIRGGNDAKAEQWLKRYGESAFDASGRLRDLNEMTLTLSRALKKAQADGRVMEFILATMRGASADAITAIEDAEDVYKQAATTVKNGLLDPKFAHEVQGNINQMNDQAAKMNATFSAALLPVANEIVPRLTERMGKLTQIIADNKEMIRSFGRAAADAFLKVEQAAETVGKAFLSVGKAYYDWQKNPRQDAIIEKYKNNTDIKTVDDLIRAEQPAAFNVIKENPFLYQQTLSIYEPMFRALQDVQDEVKRKNEELAKLLKQPLSGADLSTIGQERRAIEQNPELLDTLRKARKYQEEADAILYKMNHSDYENKKLDVDIWYNELVREGEKSNEELEALAKLRSAKLEQIEKEHQKKIKEQLEKTQEYYRNAADIEYGLTHSTFEKQLRDIEQWKDAQMKKAETAEEVAGIIKNAAAKEAEAFEAAMDRIKGKLQSLDDKIFAQEHSQYEQDLRRIQQERLRYYEDFQKEGVLNPELKNKIERWYQNAVNDLNRRAKTGGDYTKQPEGAMQRGGNGIVVIGADQIIDDGLIRSQQEQIGLLVDESRLRSQLMQGLPKETQSRLAAIESTRQLANAQKNLVEQTQQTASGFQTIAGDHIVNQPIAPSLPTGGFEIIAGDKIVSMPTQQLQQFGDTLQQTTADLEQADPLQALQDSVQVAADAQKSLADSVKDFPPEYFKTLAANTESLSEMQLRLTESTMNLIDAQAKLATALSNLPTENATHNINQRQSDDVVKLNYSTQNLQDAQKNLAITTRDVDSRLRDISDIPPQSQIAQKDSGLKLGFDYDTAKDIFLTGVGLAATAAGTGVGLAVSPEIIAGAVVAALGTGIAKGSYDATTAAPDDRLNPYVEADLSQIIAPITALDEKVQSVLQELQSREQSATLTPETFSALNNLDTPFSSILQQMQEANSYESDRFQEAFGTLPNIEAGVASILQELQARGEISETQSPEQNTIDYLSPLNAIDGKLQSILTELQTKAQTSTPVTFETVVTPLNNIHTIVGNILTTLGNRQPPQINVSPNISVNLGGAYVFDNTMKRALVDDCTQQIVDNIESAVQQATSRMSYGYGA